MASDVYTIAKFLLADGSLGWTDGAAVFRGMLVGAGYTYSNVHATVSDVVSFEVSDASYGRVDITGRTSGIDVPLDRGILDAANPIFSSLDVVSPSGLIIYKQIGGDDLTPDNDSLVCFVDFPTVTADGRNFLVELDTAGLIALTTC
jgi:hypothetical protein